MTTVDRPTIRITATDFERLERLLDSPAARKMPGADALREEIERADIIDGAVPAGEFITMGATATFVEKTSGQKHELTLVYPQDADGIGERVSILAPVGSALLGLSVGQRIEWPVRGRTIKLEVLAIREGISSNPA
ncbi:MAG: nucleoside diphosphate kinase regulator [Gammaproteobacteria bacterium]